MLTVDRRCTMTMCSHLTGIYRMVGRCSNCGTEPILVMFSETHETSPADCPTCGCRGAVTGYRLATEDEIPEAVA